ncbi:MAG: ImmA/IrrE family metallo-endopeptidase [Actinomycetota bacterium]|nr:ImmA/IrrE family metallo-endopeptidase [Actinomycetota bacterium]
MIFVDSSLSWAQGRCALAHEIAHIDLKHKHSGFPWFDARQEAEADQLAARRLIGIAALAEAYAWSHDSAQLAEALNVDGATVLTRWNHLHPSERHYIEARIALIEHAA